MKKILLLALLLPLACERSQSDEALEAAADSMLAARESVTAEPRRAGAPTQFDAQTVKAGQQFGDMTVAAVQLQPGQTSAGVSGSVQFKGEVEIVGSYRAHFDYPDVKEPCFWVDVGSWSKLPRASADTRIIWFCFTNREEAVRQLGALGTQARATIIIDDYTTNISASDAFDTARLIRVVSKEAI